MKLGYYLVAFLLVGTFIIGCESNKKVINNGDAASSVNDTIRIANDSLEYEVIIIEPGFTSFLMGQPPRGHYGLTFLEIKNQTWVNEYNIRAQSPGQYDTALYPQSINYETNTKYGYEVNYLLYNYFVFFQQKYNQRFIGSRN